MPSSSSTGTAAGRRRRLRRRWPGVDALPWGSLAAAASIDDALAAAARASWTDGAFSEYASAAAFSALTQALLEAGAPVDLTAMAADFVVDELVHVELAARVAAELGGAAPYPVDLERLAPVTAPGLPAIERAAELALRISCVGEALSVPVLAGSTRAAAHPLTRAVLARIVRDERPHADLGWLVLDWCGDRVDRARLGGVAARALASYAPLWQDGAGGDAPAAHRGLAGWMTADGLRRTLRRAVAVDVVAPLAARGIVVAPRDEVPAAS
ncbi:MAG: ferritin-like domain-containing protein [Kofleriaceae bacterium]|nr:ferritin-like domain-containing protein [Kofleriaceae bacterium]